MDNETQLFLDYPLLNIGIKVTETKPVVEPTDPKNQNQTEIEKKTGSQKWSTKNTKTT